MVAVADEGAPPFTIRFWGVRGTVATPGPATARYGGNTSCIEVRCGDALLIFDLGTGARLLGNHLAALGTCSGHVFLTHTHLDHILGFPFFRPAYSAANRFDLWAGHLKSQQLDLHATLCELMREPLFPVPLGLMHAELTFHDFQAGAVLQPAAGVTLRTAALNHPGGATGYRLQFAGRSFALVTDTEHVPGRPDGAVLELIAGADLVVYDTTYTDAELPRFTGWGHSTWEEGVRLCRMARAKRLVAFHHDPDRDDAALDRIAKELDAAMPGALVAAEGLVLSP